MKRERKESNFQEIDKNDDHAKFDILFSEKTLQDALRKEEL